MKKDLLVLSLLISLSFFAFAQVDYKMEQASKWGCSIAINDVDAQVGTPLQSSWGYATSNFENYADKTNNSLSLSIILKYFISDDVLLRFEFGITDINMSSYFDTENNIPYNSEQQTTQITIKQNVQRYIPGIQWSILKKKKIECYFGMTASYVNYNTMHYNYYLELRELPIGTITSVITDNMMAKGGFTAGIGSFVGFNVYLYKHISLGAEFSSSLLYYRLGGGFGGVETSQSIPNPISVETYSYSYSSYKGIQFSQIMSSINISVWF